MSKTTMVKYVKKVDILDKIGYPRFASKKVSITATKRYHSTLMLMFALPECARNLMDYLMEKMTDENIVHSNQFTRDSFNNNIYAAWLEYFKADCQKEGSVNFKIDPTKLAAKKKYSDVTIRKAFGTLRGKGLILSQTRGVFMVNPEYFFKKSEASRLDKVKMYLEFENGVDIIKMKTEGL